MATFAAAPSPPICPACLLPPMTDNIDLLKDIEGRHSQLLSELDALNDRIEAVLAENTTRTEQ
ncbi:hypothetical protein [Aeoliella mucimassa]|nr:hypothetical protein [Aeoliella mucimassa]